MAYELHQQQLPNGSSSPQSNTGIHEQFNMNYETNAKNVISSLHPNIQGKEISIYDVRSNLRCRIILGTVSLVAALLPFCDTIYLPSLEVIRHDLQTSEVLVNVSVSIYLFMNGLSGLIWGPLSDRYGRKLILLISLGIFLAVSIVCIFAPNITVLIVFRAMQGAAVAATLAVGQGVIADTYPPHRRGWAVGVFFVPVLLGPVVGPLIGGALSAKFGWRSTFVLLAVLSFVIIVSVFFILPETQHYIVQQRFKQRHKEKLIRYEDERIKPSFQKPWIPLQFLIDITIAPYVTIATATFAGLFISLTLFGSYLSQEPYEKGETIIGVLFVPVGFAMLVGSLLGGWLSDKAGIYFTPRFAEGRLVPAIAFSIFTPIGLLIYGWAFHYRLHLSVGIIGQIMLGFGQSVHQPGVFAYLTAKKQKDAAAASAANSLLNFCGAGVGVTIAVPLQNGMGIGGFYSLISGINIVAILVASVFVYRAIRSDQSCRIIVKNETNTDDPPVFTRSDQSVNVKSHADSKKSLNSNASDVVLEGERTRF